MKRYRRFLAALVSSLVLDSTQAVGQQAPPEPRPPPIDKPRSAPDEGPETPRSGKKHPDIHDQAPPETRPPPAKRPSKVKRHGHPSHPDAGIPKASPEASDAK
jgi:hypothetical protein